MVGEPEDFATAIAFFGLIGDALYTGGDAGCRRRPHQSSLTAMSVGAVVKAGLECVPGGWPETGF